MAEELQGPSGPHGSLARVNPLDNNEREDQQLENPGIPGASGAAPALADDPTE